MKEELLQRCFIIAVIIVSTPHAIMPFVEYYFFITLIRRCHSLFFLLTYLRYYFSCATAMRGALQLLR